MDVEPVDAGDAGTAVKAASIPESPSRPDLDDVVTQRVRRVLADSPFMEWNQASQSWRDTASSPASARCPPRSQSVK
jgi:hypothetical protein